LQLEEYCIENKILCVKHCQIKSSDIQVIHTPTPQQNFFLDLDYALIMKTLRYKPEGRGFDLHSVTGMFHLHNHSGRTMALGSTQPLTEMSTRNTSWG
jgi:hypothetical protein